MTWYGVAQLSLCTVLVSENVNATLEVIDRRLMADDK